MPEQHPVDPDTGRRLEAAFAALATREVPDAAPRPATAPRPPAERPRITPRRLGIAGAGLLVAAAAVTVAVLIGGEVQQARPTPSVPAGTSASVTAPPTSPAPSTPPSSPAPGTTPVTPSTPAPSLADVTTAFASVSRDSRSDVVTVPGGFEAADLTGDGTIRFWRYADGAWTVDGTSTHLPDFDSSPGEAGSTASIRRAALLTGMEHATFVLDNQAATGDGTGVDVAYTDGPDGWGAIVAGADANLHPSGRGVTALGQDGALYGGDLVDGLLQTTDCSTTVPDLASCGDAAYQVVKTWRWDGAQFVLDGREGPAS